MDDSCPKHSGFCEAIENLKKSDTKQWEEIKEGRNRMDNIMIKLNAILGGIVVAILMLLANIVFKIV